MISGRRKPIASLVLAGSLLLSGQSDAAAASTPSISNNRNGRRGGYNEHHNRQLRTRKLSKGSERSEPGGDVATRNANGDGGGFPPPVLAGCFRDFKVCDATGTLVSRNAALGCDFDPCPPAGHGDKADSDNNTSYPTEGGNQNEPPANDAPKTYTPIGIIEENMPVTPGESDNGYNKGDFLLVNGAWVGCDWVGKKMTERRCEVVTANNELVSDMCPEICNAAEMAMTTVDDTSPKNLADMESASGNGNFTLASGIVEDCDWVAKKIDTRCHKKTDDGRQVRYLCPVCTHVVQVVTPVVAVGTNNATRNDNTVSIGEEEKDDESHESDGLRS